jgi:NTP pyrophosphatase (non-canonical NTP hydrolase)
MVAALHKNPEQIRSELTASDCNLIHAAMGVSGEAGELLDAVKKAVIYRIPLNVENVIEELGDLEFFMEQIRAELGIPREETLAANMAKLAKRYENFKYSNAAAQARNDKA